MPVNRFESGTSQVCKRPFVIKTRRWVLSNNSSSVLIRSLSRLISTKTYTYRTPLIEYIKTTSPDLDISHNGGRGNRPVSGDFVQLRLREV